jgi:ligand-binding sensor domain-containing protein
MSDNPLVKQPTKIVPQNELRVLLNRFLREGEGDTLAWKSISTEDGLPHNWIYDLFQDSKGNIWVGTWGGGAALRTGTKWRIFTTESGLESNAVTSFAEGKDGRIWIATDQGLNFFDGSGIQSAGLVGKSLLDIILDRDGNLWAGCWRMGISGGGLFRFSGLHWESFTLTSGLPGMEILKVFEDSRGNIWIGTYEGGVGAGVGCFDGNKWTRFTRSDGLIDNCVYSMFEDPDGNMWFGTIGGVSVFEPARGKWHSLTTLDGIIHDCVYSMFIDANKKMWFGTEGGVSRYDGRSWRSFTTADGLVENLVRTILEDRDGNIWFGTYPYAAQKGGISIARYARKPETLQERLQKYLPGSAELKRLGPDKQ